MRGAPPLLLSTTAFAVSLCQRHPGHTRSFVWVETVLKLFDPVVVRLDNKLVDDNDDSESRPSPSGSPPSLPRRNAASRLALLYPGSMSARAVAAAPALIDCCDMCGDCPVQDVVHRCSVCRVWGASPGAAVAGVLLV